MELIRKLIFGDSGSVDFTQCCGLWRFYCGQKMYNSGILTIGIMDIIIDSRKKIGQLGSWMVWKTPYGICGMCHKR